MTVCAALVTSGLFAAATLALPSAAASLTDELRGSLMEDLVETLDGNFVLDRYVLCELSLPAALGGGTPFRRFQVEVNSEAPAEGLISRDNFVAVSVRLFSEARVTIAGLVPGMTPEQASETLRCRHDIRPIQEKSEYGLSIRMKIEGVETILTDHAVGTVKQVTRPWPEVLRRLSPREGRRP